MRKSGNLPARVFVSILGCLHHTVGRLLGFVFAQALVLQVSLYCKVVIASFVLLLREVCSLLCVCIFYQASFAFGPSCRLSAGVTQYCQARRSSDSDAKSETECWCWIDPIFLQQLGDETQFLRAFSGNKESDYCMMSSPRARSSSPDAGSLLGNPSFQVKHFRHNVVCGSHLRSHVLTVHWRYLFCPGFNG